ncbi:MAG: type II secretion system protein [Planctomycetota bacterium]
MTKQKGFTLIELLVVIAIIALLMAILMPALTRVKSQAKAAVCMSNLHQFGIAWSLFLTDRNGKTPTELAWCFQTCDDDVTDPTHRHSADCEDHLLWPYFKDEDLLVCPAAVKPLDTPVPGQSQRGDKFHAAVEWYDAPEITWEPLAPGRAGKHYLMSYGSNFWFSQDTGNVRGEKLADGTPKLWGLAPGSILAARNANMCPLMTDSIRPGNCPLPMDQPPLYDGDYYPFGGGNKNEIKNFCINRHDGYVDVLFLDFTVRRVSLKGLWYIWWHRGWPIPTDPLYPPPDDWDNPAHWMHPIPLEY